MIEALIAMIGGKAVVAGGGIIAILIGFIAMFKAAFSAGKNSELAKDAKSTLDAIKTAKAIDEKVDALSPDERRKELAKWSKPSL